MSISRTVSAPPAFIVGIGASAGGLAALESFFDCMPDDSGMAFVVVQHLSPDFKSLMDELLSRHTSMPIYQVSNDMALDADSIYLIPPKTRLTIRDEHLFLAERKAHNQPDLPIDLFFSSLADDSGERAIAIVLSGTGSDGSRGIRKIAEKKGLYWFSRPIPPSLTGCRAVPWPPESAPVSYLPTGCRPS